MGEVMRRFKIETKITDDMPTKAIVDGIMIDVIPNAVEVQNTSLDHVDRPSLLLSVQETANFLEDIINGILNRT